MGLTPVEGLLMGTRCGDLDPGVIPFLMNKEKLDAAGVSELINKHSGVAGVSGGSSDMRELDTACKEGNARAMLAMNMYSYKVKKYVGAYAAAMGGVDIIVFTGGVGENQASLREDVCQDMQFMGIDFDSKINNTVHGTEQVVSKTNSKVTVIVVPTDEELTIATDTEKVLKKK
jgi:acetate kinase